MAYAKDVEIKLQRPVITCSSMQGHDNPHPFVIVAFAQAMYHSAHLHLGSMTVVSEPVSCSTGAPLNSLHEREHFWILID